VELKDVLVFTPVLRLEAETVEAIFALEWDGAISYLFQRDNPIGEQRDRLKRGVMNHLHQYQRGREAFLAGRYEAMLVIESDIIPPRDALKRLDALGADVAYGVYLFRASPVVNVYRRYYPWPRTSRNVGEPLSGALWEQAKRQGVVECSGGGFGCVLIQRKVLEAVPFRVEWPQNGAHCDTWWTNDVHAQGFRMMADVRVVCGHKDVDGSVAWPA
jgi:hypothetical protein